MMMVGCGDDDEVDLLADFVVHLPIIREHLRFVRVTIMGFQIALYLGVSFFVRINDGINVVFTLGGQPLQMVHLPSAATDERTVEFVSSGCPKNIGTRKETGSGERARRQRSAFDKSAAI